VGTPSAAFLGRTTSPICCVCGTPTVFQFEAQFIQRHTAALHLCPSCEFLCAFGVTWLDEAYSNEIAVTDSGSGISPEFLPQIFERFSQQESGTGKSFAGLGIGLTIVKHLVDIHHGTIEVESAPGKGATFRVLLPMYSARDGRGADIESQQIET